MPAGLWLPQSSVEIFALPKSTLNKPNVGSGLQHRLRLAGMDAVLFPDLLLNVLQPDDPINTHEIIPIVAGGDGRLEELLDSWASVGFPAESPRSRVHETHLTTGR
jgi:hypothetical protein